MGMVGKKGIEDLGQKKTTAFFTKPPSQKCPYMFPGSQKINAWYENNVEAMLIQNFAD